MRRRKVIQAALWAAFGLLCWPFVAFVREKRFRPPLEIRIRQDLKPGEHIVEKDLVLFMTENGPFAVSRQCTHLGCRINYIQEKGIFICPCHQSRFTAQGKRIAGPAKRDLPRFRVVTGEGGELVVQIPRGIG